MISLQDYGAAATILICVALTEMFSNLGWHQFIIQNPEGNSPRFQSSLHGLSIFRGLATSIIIFALGAPIAEALRTPELGWAFQLLAVVPLIKSLEHLDIYRLTRKNNFRALMFTKTSSISFALISIGPLMLVYDDYRMLLYSIIVQYAFSTAVSHLMAARPYRISFDLSVVSAALAFGWPLLVNNMLLFAVMQGDRVIVVQTLGLEQLAVFSMGLTLTMAPAGILSQSIAAFFLPRLAAERSTSDRFVKMAGATMHASLVAGVVLVLGTFFIGLPLVPFLLNSGYTALVPLLGWLAVAQAVRGLTSGCATIALAQGHTFQPMVASAVRVLALPAAWIAANYGASLLEIVWIAIVAELVAFWVALVLVYNSTRRARHIRGFDRLATALGNRTAPPDNR
jgi:O-antigen/teichoic acid export membrane protein